MFNIKVKPLLFLVLSFFMLVQSSFGQKQIASNITNSLDYISDHIWSNPKIGNCSLLEQGWYGIYFTYNNKIGEILYHGSGIKSLNIMQTPFGVGTAKTRSNIKYSEVGAKGFIYEQTTFVGETQIKNFGFSPNTILYELRDTVELINSNKYKRSRILKMMRLEDQIKGIANYEVKNEFNEYTLCF